MNDAFLGMSFIYASRNREACDISILSMDIADFRDDDGDFLYRRSAKCDTIPKLLPAPLIANQRSEQEGEVVICPSIIQVGEEESSTIELLAETNVMPNI